MSEKNIPYEIYALVETMGSPHVGTFSDTDDGGEKYINAAKLIEKLSTKKLYDGNPQENYHYNAAIDRIIDMLKNQTPDPMFMCDDTPS